MHRKFYRLPDDTLQTSCLAKVFLLMEDGKLENQRGKSLDEIIVNLPDDENSASITCTCFYFSLQTLDALSAIWLLCFCKSQWKHERKIILNCCKCLRQIDLNKVVDIFQKLCVTMFWQYYCVVVLIFGYIFKKLWRWIKKLHLQFLWFNSYNIKWNWIQFLPIYKQFRWCQTFLDFQKQYSC
jgi:hypothetical protein